MKLKPLGKNVTELKLASGAVVLFSYQTAVAAQLASGGFVMTDTYYSVTTRKHITQWLDGRKAAQVAQATMDAIANGGVAS